MKYFRVKNLSQYQHYKNRNPPWIKLYNSLLDDYEFGQYPDASKYHFIAIMLLASKTDNRIPLDSKWLARRANTSEPVNLLPLFESGHLQILDENEDVAEFDSSMLDECLQGASRVQATCPNNGCTSRVEESTVELEKSIEETPLSVFDETDAVVDEAIDSIRNDRDTPAKKPKWTVEAQKVFEFYQEHLTEYNAIHKDNKRPRLRVPKVFNDVDKGKVVARLKEGHTTEDIFKGIRGCISEPHNNGSDSEGNGRAYCGLELICRNGAKLEAFMGCDDNQTRTPGQRPSRSREDQLQHGYAPAVVREGESGRIDISKY